MAFSLPASSSLTFVAGILAGAGINLLTSTAIAAPPHVFTVAVGVDAALWVIAAGCLFAAAQTIRHGEWEAASDTLAGRLTADERRAIHDLHDRRSWQRARLPLALTVVAFAGALALLPLVG